MFSVVVPIYNHEAYLVDAVHSAARDSRVTEVLLVDDGSVDASPLLASALAARFPGKVRNLTESGSHNLDAPGRYNQLVPLCSNEWIAILNSDDTFTPGRFEAMASFLTLHEEDNYDFVFGDLLHMDTMGSVFNHKRALREPEFPHPLSGDADIRTESVHPAISLASQNYIATTSNMVFTKSLFAHVGGFRKYRYCHDWDFAFRACILGRPHYIPTYTVNYRTHHSNTIAESSKLVRLEVQKMFALLEKDFPIHFALPEVVAWKNSNLYLQQ